MAKRYEKVKTIGKGGFSTVYLVRDTQKSPPEKCVLKEMDVVQMSSVFIALGRATLPPNVAESSQLRFRRSRTWPSRRCRCYGPSTTQTSSSIEITSFTKAINRAPLTDRVAVTRRAPIVCLKCTTRADSQPVWIAQSRLVSPCASQRLPRHSRRIDLHSGRAAE